MSTFPAAGDYYKAVQAPDRAFTVPKLQAAEFVWDALGPTLARGSSAVVFQATVDGSPQALRCYIRNDASSRDRYSALSAYLASQDLSPYVSGTIWLDSAIRVKGATWPVLQMGWIDGRTLNEYVDFLVTGSNAAALATLAVRWREMVMRLQESDFAHGDLQHGNVLVDQEGQLRLVDFDGVWIPQLAGQAPPTEYGHPNYQRPGLHEWDRWLDTFSALVIYLSLVALSKDPGLWLALYNSKNLLFSRGDFFAPFETEAWKQLAALHDPQVDELVRRLRECCAADWASDKSLEMTLAQPPVAPAQPTIPAELRWWEKKPATPALPGAGALPGASAAPGASALPGASAAPGASALPGAGAAAPAPSAWPRSSPGPAAGPAAGQPVRPVAAAPPTMIIPASVSAAASLPAPPPLSAPLGVAGTGPLPQLRRTMAPAGATWWTGPGPGSAQSPVGPPSPWPAPSAPPVPSRPSAPVAKPQLGQAVGAVSLGVGIVLLIVGAAAPAGILVIIGLIAAAWGIWRIVALSGTSKKPPGQT